MLLGPFAVVDVGDLLRVKYFPVSVGSEEGTDELRFTDCKFEGGSVD